MTHQEVLHYLYEKLPMFQRQGTSAYKKDLGNIRKLCTAIGNPELQFRSIHIAGTNGKGSTAHGLSAILQCAGYRTGLYTSPHLKHFSERIKLNGREVDMDWVTSFVVQYQDLIEEVSPSFFEITVAMAFAYFAGQKVDVAVVETGLGGRLDSTNILNPELSIITHIGLDHQAVLGDSIETIALEKAGIIKAGVPVVISERQPCIDALFMDKAENMRTKLWFAEDFYECRGDDSGFLDILKPEGAYMKKVSPDLKGAYQVKNYPGMLMAVDILADRGFDIPKSAVREGLEKVTGLTGFKGRWQCLGSEPTVICDTAHNESGIRYVIDQLRGLVYHDLHIVWGMVSDKDIGAILTLLPTEAHYYFCQAQVPRAMSVEILAVQAAQAGLVGRTYPGVNSALAAAKTAAEKHDIIFVGGSTFVVAEVEGL